MATMPPDPGMPGTTFSSQLEPESEWRGEGETRREEGGSISSPDVALNTQDC